MKTNATASHVRPAMMSLEGRQLMAASAYVFTPLESDTGFETDAVGINAAGQVAGGTDSSGVWTKNKAGKPVYKSLSFSGISTADPRAIGAAGSVVGDARFGDTFGADAHAAVWRAVKKKGLVATDLGVLPGGEESHARGVNAAGQVVGWSDVGNGIDHAIISKPGKKGRMTTTDLNALLPASGDYDLLDSANDINNTGGIIGLGRRTANAAYSSFFLQTTPNGATVTEIGGLPYKFSPSSRLRALNDNGLAVGFSKTNDAIHGFEEHAVLWSLKNGQQTLTDLNPSGDGSHAMDVNNKGQVVGDFDVSGIEHTHGFIFQVNKKGKAVFTDLNALIPKNSGWTITAANGINEAGQIAAEGMDAQGHERALLLTLRSAKGKTAAIVPATTTEDVKSPAVVTAATPFGTRAITAQSEDAMFGTEDALY